jgi:predicted ATPase with chaperone activity
MDRVELRLFLKPVPVDQGLSQDSTSWVDLKAPVELARKRQSARGQDVNQANVDLDLPALRRFSGLQPAHENLLGKWGRQEDWSTRALQAVLKVALTLADLDDSVMELSHIEQACRLRSPQGGEPWRD